MKYEDPLQALSRYTNGKWQFAARFIEDTTANAFPWS
jgi:hypothetical protein